MNSIEVTRSAKEVDQLVKDFEKDRGRKDLPALSEAVMQNKLDIAQALIDRQADVNEYAKKPAAERGMAPIHFAESPEAVKMLHAAGAKIDAPYKEVDHPWGMRGETKLQSLALTGRAKDVPVIDALLQAGADSNRAFAKEYEYSKDSTLAASDRVERGGATMPTRLALIREDSKPQIVMQLSTKASDEKAYTLSYEGADFHKIMTEASKLQANGTDILVNEKSNPNVVHAKSNIDNNIDIGRVIQPSTTPDGIYVRGKGEVLLPSFFDKLPIETKAVTAEREGLDARDYVAGGAHTVQFAKVGGPVMQGVAKSVGVIDAAVVAKDVIDGKPVREIDVATAASSVVLTAGAGGTAVQVGAQTVAGLGVLDAANRGINSHDDNSEKQSAGRKIVLTKSDYALPEKILADYKVQDGKFTDIKTDALRFEDHGKKLSTPVEDRAVIADMIAVAAAKNWPTLELKGTDNFKQIAWLEASALGMGTKNYTPNERDLEQLDHLKRERGMTSDKPAIAGAPDKTGNSIEVVVGRERTSPEVATEAPAKPAPKTEKPGVPSIATADPAHDTVRDDRPTGKLLDHGPAKFNFNPKENDNYFVKLDTANGEKVIWGKDLERAISEAAVKKGDSVTLTRKGSEDVVVDRNKLDDNGRIVGKESIDAFRNKWEVKPVEIKVERSMTNDEKLKVDGIAKVLSKQIAKYPESERQKIISSLTEGINNGSVNLAQVPAPKVSVRSVEKPVPEQTRDRGVKQEQVRSR